MNVSEISARRARHFSSRRTYSSPQIRQDFANKRSEISEAPEILKPKVLMSLLEDSNCLIRHLATENSFSNVRSTANRIKTVCIANAVPAKQQNDWREDRNYWPVSNAEAVSQVMDSLAPSAKVVVLPPPEGEQRRHPSTETTCRSSHPQAVPA